MNDGIKELITNMNDRVLVNTIIIGVLALVAVIAWRSDGKTVVPYMRVLIRKKVGA